jgi:ABC-type sugar transport system permease subunit
VREHRRGGALFSTIAMVIWRFAGFQMLILLTGLQAIPLELYEAARVDGATRWQLSGASPCRCCARPWPCCWC